MLRSSISTSRLLLSLSLSHPRALSTTALLRSGNHPLSPGPTKPPQSPPTTQGHAVDKTVKKDVQSQYAQQGQDERKAASAQGGRGEDQPFDAARMDGGEGKKGEKGGGSGETGAFKDQVGGQMGGAGGMGGTTEASGETTGEKVKKALGMKSSRKFHTSARIPFPASPGGSGNHIPGARDPKESGLHGDQNQHLTHSEGGKDNADRKGNAAEEPHLPSKNKNKSTSGKGEKGERGMHTSAKVGVKEAGYAGAKQGEGKEGQKPPPEALPQTLSSAYSSTATPTPDSNLTPSSELPFSSTAQDPPHDVLKQKVLDGEMEKKNPQPSGKVGKQGLDKAWKKRQA